MKINQIVGESMADFFVKTAQEKFPTATIRKNGETIQQAPQYPKQEPVEKPIDLEAVKAQLADLEEKFKQLGGDSYQYADRMMDRDREAQRVHDKINTLKAMIKKAEGNK